MKDMQALANHPALRGIWMDQVQDFTPTPMTTSSVMFWTGLDPRDMTPVFTEHDPEKKRLQKSFFFAHASTKEKFSDKKVKKSSNVYGNSKKSLNIAPRKGKPKK